MSVDFYLIIQSVLEPENPWSDSAMTAWINDEMKFPAEEGLLRYQIDI